MEKTYQQKRVMKDGSIKFYTYKKMTKGCEKRGAQITTRGKIARKLKEISDDDAASVLTFINNLKSVVVVQENEELEEIENL